MFTKLKCRPNTQRCGNLLIAQEANPSSKLTDSHQGNTKKIRKPEGMHGAYQKASSTSKSPPMRPRAGALHMVGKSWFGHSFFNSFSASSPSFKRCFFSSADSHASIAAQWEPQLALKQTLVWVAISHWSVLVMASPTHSKVQPTIGARSSAVQAAWAGASSAKGTISWAENMSCVCVYELCESL